jgi:hypothetical protein
MDVTRILEADHREVAGLIAQINAADGEARQPLVDQLGDALRGHMELEETVVYPVMREVTGEESLQEANTEHELARKALADVLRLAPDKPGFGAALDALEAGVKHHVDEEEAEIFPELRKSNAAMEGMATPFVERRLALGLPLAAPALSSAFSKDELLQEAESAGVKDASKMKKDELAEALAAKLA